MIHPDTQLKWINAQIGHGVFATAPIPRGTVVYVQDALDIVIGPEDPLLTDPDYQDIIDKYAYIDPRGDRIVSWDIARYVNHCCHCNTISTGYGFEIAIRDIDVGEQLTDEYGVFNFDEPIPVVCHHKDCRKKVLPEDIDTHSEKWDDWIRQALSEFQDVSQPLLRYLDPRTHAEVMDYLRTGRGYKSIQSLSYIQPDQNKKVKRL